MFKFAHLILKNLGRNKVRTSLTCSAVLVLVLIYSVVSSILGYVQGVVGDQARQTRLIVSERWTTPSRFPLRYVERIGSVPGVVDWTAWNWKRGYFDASRQNDRRGDGIATRVDNLRTMYPGLEELDPAVIEAMRQDRTAAIVGPAIMQTMKWSVGQRFTFVNPKPTGEDLEFKIVGVLPAGRWASNFFFRDDYFREATGNQEYVNMMWVRVEDPAAAQRVTSEIEQMFANSQPEIKVETESAGASRFTGRSQDLLSLINVVVYVLLIDMAIILSNSISMTTRDRRVEMAVLKVLGFGPGHVMALVMGEAVLLGAVSGLAGAGLAWGISMLNARGALPLDFGFLSQFPIPLLCLPQGMLVGAAIGLLGSLLPAWNSRQVRITEVFSQLA